MKNTACRPKIIVSADGSGIVSQAGALLLTQVLQVTGLGRQLSAGLARWRAPRAVHDPGKMVADLAVALALGCPYVIFYSEVTGADLGFCSLIGPGVDLRSWLRWLRYVEAERDRLAEQLEYAALFRGRC
jgi:hypothetical protein